MGANPTLECSCYKLNYTAALGTGRWVHGHLINLICSINIKHSYSYYSRVFQTCGFESALYQENCHSLYLAFIG